MENQQFNIIERAYGQRNRGKFVQQDQGISPVGMQDVSDSPWLYNDEVSAYYEAGAPRTEAQKLASGGYLKPAEMTPQEREYTQPFTYTTTGQAVVLVATQEKARELSTAGTPAFVKKSNAIAKFSGLVLATHLWIDIDVDGDIPKAQQYAVESVAILESHGVPSEHIQVRFSGNKGFHLLFPATYVGSDLFGPQEPQKLARKLQDSMPAIFPHADVQCYGPTQLLRVPNTINSKSGLYCIPLTVDQLRTLNADQIKELAKAAHFLPTPAPDASPILQAEALRDRFIQEIQKAETKRLRASGKQLFAGATGKEAVERLVAWMDANNWPHQAATPRDAECTLIRLQECPLNTHSPGSDQGSFLVFENGAIVFNCLHTGCQPVKSPITGRTDHTTCTQNALAAISARSKIELALVTPKQKKDYTQLADGIAKDLFAQDGIQTLRFHRSVYYQYRGNSYVEYAETDLDSDIMIWLREHAPEQASNTTVDNIRSHVAALGNVCASQNFNTWTDGEHAEGEYMSFNNGILNLDAHLNGEPLEDCFYEHSPSFFSNASVPFDFDPKALCPRFMAFLEEVQPDASARQFLQEFSGYTFTSDCRFQTFAFLHGKGSNGKNTFGDIIAGLHHASDVASVAVNSFGDRFALWPLANCRLNYVSESPTFCGATSLKVAEEKLKAAITGDLLQVERKNRDSYPVRPMAKHLFMGNELPALHDRSEGTWRRLVIIGFPICIEASKRVPGLAARLLKEEAAGIFNWALEGLKTLRARGRFVEPQTSVEMKEEHKLSMQHEVQFLMDNYEQVTGESEGDGDGLSELPFPVLYGSYSRWAASSGYSTVGANKFGEAVMNTFQGVGKVRKTIVINYERPESQKVVCYVGLRKRAA